MWENLPFDRKIVLATLIVVFVFAALGAIGCNPFTAPPLNLDPTATPEPAVQDDDGPYQGDVIVVTVDPNWFNDRDQPTEAEEEALAEATEPISSLERDGAGLQYESDLHRKWDLTFFGPVGEPQDATWGGVWIEFLNDGTFRGEAHCQKFWGNYQFTPSTHRLFVDPDSVRVLLNTCAEQDLEAGMLAIQLGGFFFGELNITYLPEGYLGVEHLLSITDGETEMLLDENLDKDVNL